MASPDMYGLPLWEQITHCLRMLDAALRECKERGQRMVATEAAYYTAKAQAAFRLREEGHPATFIGNAIKGEADVCAAMMEYHAAQVEYENAREARNVWKKKLDTLREQYQREWGREGMEA